MSQIEDRDAPGTRRRSWRIVRGRWLKVGSLTILGGAVALAIGPFLGALMIVLTQGQAPFALVNLVAGDRLRRRDAVRRTHHLLRILRCPGS